MKLRIARKIIDAVCDEHGNITDRHNDTQRQRANIRYNQSKSAKHTEAWYKKLIRHLHQRRMGKK